MIFGYVASVKTGAWWARATFAAGACIEFWAHFLLVLPFLGLAAAHMLAPGLPGRYTRRAFVFDALAISAACAPALPYLIAAAARPQHLTWMAVPHHFEIGALLAPFALPWVMVAASRSGEHGISGLVLALSASILGVVLALEAGLLVHANLVTARYLEPIVVPASVLAGVAISRLIRREAAVCLVAFLAINGANIARAYGATGTFSGLGVEDWRGASDLVREAIRTSGSTVVLLRSGFVEESLPVPGHAPPATRAVLDSPGRPPLDASVVSLTYRWSDPGRVSYFDNVVAPAIDDSHAFVLVAQHAVDSDGVYSDNVRRWVAERFGSDVVVRQPGAVAGIDVYLFVRP